MICLEYTVRVVKQTHQVHYLGGEGECHGRLVLLLTRRHSLVRHVTM